MLARFIFKPSHLRRLTVIYSQTHLSKLNLYSPVPNPSFNLLSETSRHFSSNKYNNGDKSTSSASDLWKLSSENDQNIDSVFAEDATGGGGIEGIFDVSVEGSKAADHESWLTESTEKSGEDIFKGIEHEQLRAAGDSAEWAIAGKPIDGSGGIDNNNEVEDIFKGIEQEAESPVDGIRDEDWATVDGHSEWNFVHDDKEKEADLFDIGEGKLSEKRLMMQGLVGDDDEVEVSGKSEEEKQLESEKKKLTAVLKGPDCAFGDLIAASGITEAMLDSLIALKDMEGVEGLPPLSEIEKIRYKKNTRKSTRAEIELQKQEEVAKARVRQVDDKGRAYGTGRRKCSIARVWIQPGDGKFLINDKQFDVYFPMLDHRAALLRPFSETKTLGLWDVGCTVKGGGVSGQVGAVQLGVSRALQNWEPDLRPPLKEVGFLTRDSRIVERKKPGKAKARKSFQWVKR